MFGDYAVGSCIKLEHQARGARIICTARARDQIMKICTVGALMDALHTDPARLVRALITDMN